MNYSLVIRIFAVLSCTLALLLLIPAIVALCYGETAELQVFVKVALSVGLVGLVVLFLGKNAHFSLSSHDGFLVVSLAWVFMAGVGAVPFVLSGTIPSYTDAFFETMSGFTTTGATILTEIEILPRSILFWRSFTHWIGGMGIIVLTVAILPLLGFKGLQLVRARSTRTFS
jgi:trk system potassium uptake protein TrkH